MFFMSLVFLFVSNFTCSNAPPAFEQTLNIFFVDSIYYVPVFTCVVSQNKLDWIGLDLAEMKLLMIMYGIRYHCKNYSYL